jgi:DNA-directed RNA polymerase subunit RPC12/RpoP
MALIKCSECGKEISSNAAACPNCGNPIVSHPNVPIMPATQKDFNAKPKKKKRGGCFIGLLCAVALFIAVAIAIENLERTVKNTPKPEIILDAMSFYTDDTHSATLSEEELVARLGQPDEIEEWKYQMAGNRYYPIRTLIYGNWRYNLTNNKIYSISADDAHIPYASKNDILAMFNLMKYRNSTIVDTGVAYRVDNCGINSLYVIMTDTELNSIRIKYVELL